MNRKVAGRVFLIGALLIAVGGILWLVFGGLGESLVYYWSPSELLAAGEKGKGATVRLGGQVKEGSVKWKPGQQDLNFVVTDGSADVAVHASAVPPQMFREGIGVVIEGTMGAGGVFQSERLMVKHGNEYQPPEEGSDVNVKRLTESLEEGSGT